MVARVLAPDQGEEGEGDALGRDPAVAVDHRAAHVEQEDGRAARRQLGPVDLEVVGLDPEGEPGTVAAEGVGEGALEVEEEGVAELVALGDVGPVATGAAPIGHVLAGAVAAEGGEDLGEGALADLADGGGGQLPAAPLSLEVAGFLELLGQAPELGELVDGLVAETPAEGFGVDQVGLPALLGGADLAFELVEVVEVAHDVERLLERERRLAPEPVAARRCPELCLDLAFGDPGGKGEAAIRVRAARCGHGRAGRVVAAREVDVVGEPRLPVRVDRQVRARRMRGGIPAEEHTGRLRGERRQLTVWTCDIRGFAAYRLRWWICA